MDIPDSQYFPENYGDGHRYFWMNKISKNDRFLKTNDKNKNERFNIVLTNLKKRSYFTEWTNFRKDLEITMVFFLLKEQFLPNFWNSESYLPQEQFCWTTFENNDRFLTERTVLSLKRFTEQTILLNVCSVRKRNILKWPITLRTNDCKFLNDWKKTNKMVRSWTMNKWNEKSWTRPSLVWSLLNIFYMYSTH